MCVCMCVCHITKQQIIFPPYLIAFAPLFSLEARAHPHLTRCKPKASGTPLSVFFSADAVALLQPEDELEEFSKFSALRQVSFMSHTHLLRLDAS